MMVGDWRSVADIRGGFLVVVIALVVVALPQEDVRRERGVEAEREG